MKLRSLRGRFVVAVVIWAVGVLGVSIVAMAAIPHHSGWATKVHFSLPIIFGMLFTVGGLQVVRRGLSQLLTLRERLAAVRDGRTARVDGEYPAEVAPLVEDLNLLLDDRERRVARAVAKAGDLAHGLKTPLAILTQDIDRAAAAGQDELAASIRWQVERMRRQIDSHLAQARATAGAMASARANVGDAARGLVRAMERLYADRALAITVDASADRMVRVPVEDLEEMLGNLLDNACKWARSQVSVSAAAGGPAGDTVVIDVDDDGEGLDPSMREHVLQRGARADEAAPGSGLGLAIVSDLADAYGGSVALDRSPAGGVRARLTLPATGASS